MENKTKGQLERMQWYNNLCKETGYEPLRGNPYAENSSIVEFEKAHDYCEQQRKELRNERI